VQNHEQFSAVPFSSRATEYRTYSVHIAQSARARPRTVGTTDSVATVATIATGAVRTEFSAQYLCTLRASVHCSALYSLAGKGRVILKGTPYVYLRALSRPSGQTPPPPVWVPPENAEPPHPLAPDYCLFPICLTGKNMHKKNYFSIFPGNISRPSSNPRPPLPPVLHAEPSPMPLPT
jgi:hypothetical protein